MYLCRQTQVKRTRLEPTLLTGTTELHLRCQGEEIPKIGSKEQLGPPLPHSLQRMVMYKTVDQYHREPMPIPTRPHRALESLKLYPQPKQTIEIGLNNTN